MKLSARVAAAALLSAGHTLAASLSFCLQSNQDICFQLAVPEATAQAGSGNFYFQMKAPTSYAWIALGTGTRMSGSNIFVMYQDGNGNVTISPRLGEGHSEPQHSTNAADLTLLEGSGVSNGEMVANVLCTNCDSWSGGQLDFSGTGDFISAWREGTMQSSDPGASISQHNGRFSFQAMLSSASVASETDNPFVSSGGGGGDGGDGSNNDEPGNGDSGNDNPDGNDPGSDNSPGNPSSTPGIIGGSGNEAGPDSRLVVHGVLMAITFVALYPIGAFLMPLLGKWFVHAGWQTIAFILMWVAFGIGYVLAQDFGMLFNNTHTILGTVVCSMMALQPIFGYLHHLHFLKHQGRGVISYVHIFYGRALIAVGIINGGLGLQLANAPSAAVIAYIVVTVALTALWAVIVLVKTFKKGSATDRQPRTPYKTPATSRDTEHGKYSN